MSEEEWRSIEGGPGYEISSLGRFRSIDRTIVTRAGVVARYSGRIRKSCPDTGGYLTVTYSLNDCQRTARIHVLVAAAFLGPRPAGLHVCHNDGDLTNNVPRNLRYDTVVANNRDILKHGRNALRRRTHCPRGHPLQMPNLVPSQFRVGHRQCLACKRALRQREYHSLSNEEFIQACHRHYARIMETAT